MTINSEATRGGEAGEAHDGTSISPNNDHRITQVFVRRAKYASQSNTACTKGNLLTIVMVTSYSFGGRAQGPEVIHD